MKTDKTKYLKFLTTIKNDDSTIIWNKDEKYLVTYEADDAYYLGEQNGIPCGIEKGLDNKSYVVTDCLHPDDTVNTFMLAGYSGIEAVELAKEARRIVDNLSGIGMTLDDAVHLILSVR